MKFVCIFKIFFVPQRQPRSKPYYKLTEKWSFLFNISSRLSSLSFVAYLHLHLHLVFRHFPTELSEFCCEKESLHLVRPPSWGGLYCICQRSGSVKKREETDKKKKKKHFQILWAPPWRITYVKIKFGDYNLWNSFLAPIVHLTIDWSSSIDPHV